MAISIALMGILLSVLFRFVVSNARFEKKIEEAGAVVLQRQRVQERLDGCLAALESPESGDLPFYTTQFPKEETASLILYFNAGIDPDPDYSHTVTGRFYLTKEGDFCLTYWPRLKAGFRTEVLLQNVSSLQWEFLGRKGGNEWVWLNEWPKKQGGAPQMVRLRLWCGIDKKKEKEPNLQFAFVLPAQEPIAMYK